MVALAEVRLVDVDWDDAMRRYGRRVVASLLARGLPLDRAEDVAQRAWLRLIERHKSGALVDVKLPGLAVAQARWLALDDGRADARRLDVPDDAVDELADPLRVVVHKRRLDRALGVLARSSRSARDVFRLCYDDPPPTHAEVAATLGLSTQRVRQILCEVRAQMRRALEEEDA